MKRGWRLFKWLVFFSLVIVLLLFYLQNQTHFATSIPLVLHLPLYVIEFAPPNGPRVDLLLALAFGLGFAFAMFILATTKLRRLQKLRLQRKIAEQKRAAQETTKA